MVKFKKVKLGDIFKLEYGKGLVAEKRISGNYPVYGSSRCIGTHNEYLIEGPGVIIGRKGSVGEVYFSKNNFYPIDTAYYIFKNNKKYDIRFLYYFLKFLNLKRLQGDVGVPGLNRETVHGEIVPFIEDIKTQTRIAFVLSTYDDLIENNEKRIKILEEMARLLYTEWFVKFKFPGHEKVKMVDSSTEYGMVPDGWEAKKLGANLNISKGKNITKSTITHGAIPVVAGGLSPAYYHNKANVQNPVITISASGANAGFINLYQENIWASDCSYIDNNTTSFVYFYYLFLKNKQTEITRLQRGSAQPHIYPKDLMQITILDIPETLIAQLEDKVKIIFDTIRYFKKQNQHLSKTRDLLIPQLVTGKRELK